jgi:ferric-dicitrate binding protein FerR (iron transport regulator)
MHAIWNFTRTAAAILLPLFLIYQYFLLPEINRNKIQQTITVTSAPGMVTKTVLPDGSEVWLNAQSSITYPVKFTHKTRTVKLIGEAYFKVTSDKKHRFDVIIPHRITVSAYGTEFNVNAYTSANRHEVTLAKGRVDVSSGVSKRIETLAPGEKAIVEAINGNMKVASADTYAETAWKDGKMVFRREKFETITEKLSRKFGVNIQLESEKLRKYTFTATFTDESLDEILYLLTRSTPITYTISNPQQLNDSTYTKRTIKITTQ